METVLVTGAAGYLGTCLMDALQVAGYEPVALRGRLQALQPGQLAAYPLVIHAAGALRHRPQDFEGSNVQGTAHLLAALSPQVRLLHLSSRAVYGPGPGPLHEEESCQPIDPYGQSKLAAETLVRQSGLNASCLRVGLLFGPASQGQLGHSFLSQALQHLSQGQPVRVYTPDAQHDSLFVQDLAAWLVAGLATESWQQASYNLAGQARSLHQTLKDFCQGLGVPETLLHFEPGPPPRMPLMSLQRLAQALPERISHSDLEVAKISQKLFSAARTPSPDAVCLRTMKA